MKYKEQLQHLYNCLNIEQANVRILSDTVKGKYIAPLNDCTLNRLHTKKLNVQYYTEEILKLVSSHNKIQL